MRIFARLNTAKKTSLDEERHEDLGTHLKESGTGLVPSKNHGSWVVVGGGGISGELPTNPIGRHPRSSGT